MYGRGTGFSGPEILDFFSRYDIEIEAYPWSGGAPSRWQIFEDCLARFKIETQKVIIADLLDFEGPMKYGSPGPGSLERIRSWLGQGKSPVSKLTAAPVTWAGVNDAWKKAADRVTTDAAGAITSARTLLETVCFHILEARGVSVEASGDLQRLYRLTSRSLSVSPDQQSEDLFRQVMGGCATIANGLASMRNKFSDAHGRGSTGIDAGVRHARLAVNSACTLALFLLESHLAADDQVGPNSMMKKTASG